MSFSELTIDESRNGFGPSLCVGWPGMAAVMKMLAEQLREKYLATDAVEPDDLDGDCRFADDPNAWGSLLRHDCSEWAEG
jgi:hypothetical protein